MLNLLRVACIAAFLYIPFTALGQVSRPTYCSDECVTYLGPLGYTLTIKTNTNPPMVLVVPEGVQLEVHSERPPSGNGAEHPFVFNGNVVVRARQFIPVTNDGVHRLDLGDINFALALKDAEVRIVAAGQ